MNPLKKPLISIVVACYNGENFLALTLESVLAQTFADWECLIVDDGSADGTLVVAQEFAARDARFRAITQANAGVSAARNFGVVQAAPSAEFLNFLDSDDLLTPDALETLLGALTNFPEAVGSHGLADQIDEAGKPLSPGEFAAYCRNRKGFDGREIVDWPREAPTTLAVFANCYYFLPPGVALVRRRAFAQTTGFDTYYRNGGEDWDLFSRLARQGDFVFVDTTLIGYRRHGGGATNNAAAMHTAGHHVKHTLFFAPENSPAQRQMLKKAYRAWQRYKYKEKRALMQEDWTRRAARHYAVHGLQAAGHLLFCLRGYPSLKG